MRYKFLLVLIAVMSFIAFTFGLVACDSPDIEDNTDLPIIETISADNLVFGYNVDKAQLEDYFIANGQKSNTLEEVYCIQNNLATLYYYPQENKFSVMRQIVSNSTLSNAAYTYKWTCSFDIKLYDLFSNAVWAGKYEHTAINLNTLNVAAEYTAAFKFNIKKFFNVNELANFDDNLFTSSITYASDYSSANRMFEPEVEGEKIYSQFQYCFEAIETIFKQLNNNATLSGEYNAENYKSIDFSKTTFENAVYNFDNETHSIYAQNIPKNVLVRYEENNQSDTGTHTVTAIFIDPKGNVLYSLNANIEITDIFNVTVEYIYGNIVSVNGEKGVVVGTQTFQAKYNSNILDFCVFPNGFVWKDTSDNWQEFLRDDYTWKGYGDQTFSVSVVPQYEGYVQVTSDTNQHINNAIIPYSALCSAYQDNIISTKLFESESPVAFKPSDIKTIKIFNTYYLTSCEGTYYTNLEAIDLSDCIHLKSIYPDEYGSYGFFNNCENLKTVNAPNLPNLKIIGNNFFANTNIVNFNFDMSAVQQIGRNFLYNALYGDDERIIDLDLENITSINMNGFLGSINYANKPTINLYIYDYQISPVWFDNNASCNIYVSSQIDYYKMLFAEHPNINIYEINN